MVSDSPFSARTRSPTVTVVAEITNRRVRLVEPETSFQSRGHTRDRGDQDRQLGRSQEPCPRRYELDGEDGESQVRREGCEGASGPSGRF